MVPLIEEEGVTTGHVAPEVRDMSARGKNENMVASAEAATMLKQHIAIAYRAGPWGAQISRNGCGEETWLWEEVRTVPVSPPLH